MVQIDGPERHVHINVRDNGRMQDVFHSTGRQVDFLHSNGEISTVRIITLGIGIRRVCISLLPPGNVGWSTTDCYVCVRRSNGLSSRNIVSSIPLPSGQWHSTLNEYSRQTRSVAYYCGCPKSAGVIRWTNYEVLLL